MFSRYAAPPPSFFSFFQEVLAPEQARIALFLISTLGRCQEEKVQK